MILAIGLTAKEAIAVEGTNLNTSRSIGDGFSDFFKRLATKNRQRKKKVVSVLHISWLDDSTHFVFLWNFLVRVFLLGLFLIFLLDGDTVLEKNSIPAQHSGYLHVRNQSIPLGPAASGIDFKLGMETLEWRGERKAQSYGVRMLEQ